MKRKEYQIGGRVRKDSEMGPKRKQTGTGRYQNETKERQKKGKWLQKWAEERQKWARRRQKEPKGMEMESKCIPRLCKIWSSLTVIETTTLDLSYECGHQHTLIA